MVADGEERRAGGPRVDEAVEGVGVVDGGGVEQRHVRLGDGADGADHRGAGEAAEVARAASPPQRPRRRHRRRVGGRLHLLPPFFLLAYSSFFFRSSLLCRPPEAQTMDLQRLDFHFSDDSKSLLSMKKKGIFTLAPGCTCTRFAFEFFKF